MCWFEKRLTETSNCRLLLIQRALQSFHCALLYLLSQKNSTLGRPWSYFVLHFLLRMTWMWFFEIVVWCLQLCVFWFHVALPRQVGVSQLQTLWDLSSNKTRGAVENFIVLCFWHLFFYILPVAEVVSWYTLNIFSGARGRRILSHVEDCSEEPEILQVFRTALHSETFNLFPSSGKAQQWTSGASLFHSSNDPTCTGVGAFVIEKSICAAFLAGHFHGQSCDPTWNSCNLDSSTSSFFKESQHSNESFFFF